MFWLLENPSICYIGSATNLKIRFNDHFKNTLIKKNQYPKFYNYVNKYS